MKVTPITLRNIVNRISDSYLVLNSDLSIVDFNKTLLDTFHVVEPSIINKNLLSDIPSLKDFRAISKELSSAIKKTKNSDITVVLDKYFKSVNKYFHIEINRIYEKDSYLGTLILLKDVTQHKHDLQTIKNNQEILIERERLATLGQMIGGIAHNLKTPIMSI